MSPELRFHQLCEEVIIEILAKYGIKARIEKIEHHWLVTLNCHFDNFNRRDFDESFLSLSREIQELRK